MDNIRGFGNNSEHDISPRNEDNFVPVRYANANEDPEKIREQTFGNFLTTTCCPRFKFLSFIFIISCIDVVYYIITLIYGGIVPDKTQLRAPTD